MDIGTAKPDAATLAAFPHHLIDLITPEESYSAARFRADALRVMAEITARGRVPLLAGGTMLYFKALLRRARRPAAGRRRDCARASTREARDRGWPALHAELAARRPGSAARLEPNDAQRIQRALEVFRLTGAPLAERSRAQGDARARPSPRSRWRSSPRTARCCTSASRSASTRCSPPVSSTRCAPAPQVPPARRPALDALRRLPAGVGIRWRAAATARRPARDAASPPRASSPSASSPGCAHGGGRAAGLPAPRSSRRRWRGFWKPRCPEVSAPGSRPRRRCPIAAATAPAAAPARRC